MHAAIWVVFAVTFAKRAEANSAASENNAAFAALCGPIRLATSTPRNLHAKDEENSIIAAIAAINLTVADDTFTSKIERDKTWRTAPEEYTKARPGWDKYHDTWAAAKKEITGDNKQKYTNWRSFKGNKAAQAQVSHIAEEAFAINSELETLRAKLTDAPVAAALTKAIHGEAGAATKSFMLNFGASLANRAKRCSQTSWAGEDPKSGTPLLLDAICLCTTGSTSSADGGKACCDKCEETSTADKSAVAATADFQAKWAKLTTACDGLAPKPPLSKQAASQAAAAAVLVALTNKTSSSKSGSEWRRERWKN
uniref:Variant surface glycoprotein 1739 n=1 Tax=Trypanosoma brucei TaxID=5691 RepID=M4SZ66_9TRYP|nr:variant surface glycoprotein 1739 [Trypanosoma brucei]